MPKPTHLSWEEAAVNALCNSTAYRMLVSRNGAEMKQGDVVLVWGASGGLGSFAVQHVLNGGGHAGRRRLVAGEGRAAPRSRCRCGHRPAARRATGSGPTSTPRTSRSGAGSARTSAALVGDDPDIVFEHPGRQTMGASVFVCKRGGTVVTCAATSGYMIEYDNRHLWMKLKTIKGSPFRQLPRGLGREPARLRGQDRPAALGGVPARGGRRGRAIRSTTTSPRASSACSASLPSEGLGIDDPELRARRVGEDAPHDVPEARA